MSSTRRQMLILIVFSLDGVLGLRAAVGAEDPPANTQARILALADSLNQVVDFTGFDDPQTTVSEVLLADMANLQPAQGDNVLYVTSPEKAARLKKDPKRKRP